ncbi:MAG: hypothetical protein IKK89_04670 [Alistipes sp.]|nr:hypothetical protein [Alistipes sp.]MBR6631220.1 hypothetical protein [Alistipes sp.]
MRRKVELYINGSRADLDNDAIIQFTYTMEDLVNPAIVKNSYSQQVSLKGTPANNRIFGHLYRADRVTGKGFNAMAKMPFEIYREGELLERGYVKVDKMERNGADVTYSISLYGGLGSFFYALSYTEAGENLTLADLDYLGNGESLDFRTFASTITEAWGELGKAYDRTNKWHTLNFAPCYNGIPSDGFSPDKAICNPNNATYPSTTTEDGKTYTATHFIELSKEYNEWQTKDLRAYLQRPALRIRSVIEAICSKAQGLGHDVVLDASFFNESNPYYNDAWMLLPLLRNLTLAASEGEVSASMEKIFIPIASALQTFERTLSYSVSTAGCKSSANVRLNISAYLADIAQSAQTLSTIALTSVLKATYTDGTTKQTTISNVNFTTQEISGVATGVVELSLPEADNVANYSIAITTRATSSWYLVDSANNRIEVEAFEVNGGEVGTIAYTGYESARTGSLIPQDVLLASDKSLADYLLSYCKMFNLHFLYDKEARSVRIVSRNTLYSEGVAMNIEQRVDRSQKITITPYVFDAKYYDFGNDIEDGDFAKYYKDVYKRSYGKQRVDTGFVFNAESKDVLESVLFKGAIEVRERNKYFNIIKQSSTGIPSVFLDNGHEVVYRNGDATITREVPTVPSSATIEYMDKVYLSYDAVSRVQLHEAKDEALEIDSVLVFYKGMSKYYASVTDDTSEMYQMNDGTPCWLLQVPSTPIDVPMFGRYRFSGNTITHSWDFGVPAEIDIPDVTHGASATLYNKAWAKYIADRYDVDTKVVRCFVDWRGVEVNEALLRNFYYFDNSVWVLNKISNYSITSVVATECEFIKVKDLNNYQNGQTI